LGDFIPRFVDQVDAVDNVEMILPEFPQSQISVICDLKASAKQCLDIELPEACNHLLVHVLDQWCSIWWQKLHFDEI